jgi:hypothetical protein
MPSWVTQLLALLPTLIADLPAAIDAVTTLIDDIIAAFQNPPASSKFKATDNSAAIAALKQAKADLIAQAASAKP